MMVEITSRRKKGVAKPIPVDEIEKGTNYVREKVQKFLMDNNKYAYSIQRLLIDCFGIIESDITGSFKDWKNREAVSLYNKIKSALLELEKEGHVKMKKHGKAMFYWWK